MTRTLEDVFEIPHAEDLSALDFVIKLDQAAKEPTVQRLVDDYVVTPAVATALPVLFKHFEKAVVRGEAYGHILHGGFGSGKSHLMTLLAFLLEGHEAAWRKDHPAFEALRKQHRSWVRERNLLVVRVHMLSARRAGAGLDEILYDAFNQALVSQSKAPLLVGSATEVLQEIRKEALAYGDAFWKNASQHGVATGPEDLQMAEEAGDDAVKALVEAYLEMKGRSSQAAGLLPAWGEGLRRIATHTTAQGFGGVAFFIDEFLLWLAEKAGEEFVTAINDINTMVDFSGRRDAPILVVFARQRNIKEFFPDLTSQDRIQERVDHHAKRFEVTQLQDVELRYIVAGRVLRNKKDPDAVREAIAQVQTTYKRALDDLLGEQGADVLSDVYPFHPALIDVLVDVSNLMQRERSALRLLYEILAHNRTLALGDLLPVGRAFDHVFPPAGVEAAQKTETLQKIHAEWYGRLATRVDEFVRLKEQTDDPISDERANALRQVLKTVLLGLVSPRLSGKGNERLTVERLVKLNFADADGELLKNKINRTFADLSAFHLFTPELQIAGDKGAAVVTYALGQASLSEVLRRAMDKVQGKAALLTAFGKRLEAALPKKLGGLVQAKDGLPYDVPTWRGTTRRGRVLFGNVREQTYAAFQPGAGEAFRIVVDYPWDDPGHTVGEDIAHVDTVRRSKGQQTSAAWLPRHFSQQEERLLKELAAADWIVEDGTDGELVASFGRDERALLVEQAHARVRHLEFELEKKLIEVYGQQGEAKAFIGARDPDLAAGTITGNLESIVREILDRRFPQHPVYKLDPTRARLDKALAWITEAWGQTGSVHFDDDLGSILEHVLKPLELVQVGQTRAGIEHSGRFLKAIFADLGDHRSAAWTPIADKLRSEFGLTDDVIDLLLCIVCLHGYRLVDPHGDRVEPRLGLGAKGLTLEKADLLDLAPWSRARTLAEQVLEVPSDSHRSLSSQDRLAAESSRAAGVLRDSISTLQTRLTNLGHKESERQGELNKLVELLRPLADARGDSSSSLGTWVRGWPESDVSLRVAAAAIGTNLEALDELDIPSRNQLLRVRDGRLSNRIAPLLFDLDERLQSREQARPLRAEDMRRFNKEARGLVSELIETVTPPTPPTPPAPPGVTEDVVRLDAPTADQITAVANDLRGEAAAGRIVSIELRVRRKQR